MDEDERIVLTLEADDEASQKIDRVTQSLHKLDSQSGSMGKSSTHWATNFTKGFENAVGTINTVTRRYNTIMSSFNRTVKSLVSDMGSAIYDFTSDSIKNFTEFSEQHAKTLGAMSAEYSKTSEDQSRFFQDAQRLKEQAMQLGTYGVTGNGALMNTVEVSEAQTELIKAGIKAEEIADPNSTITKDVLTFAQANDLDTSTAVEFATTLGNQFGVDKSDWGLMLDKVSHTADMSVIDVRDIIASMKWAGGITAGLDRGMEETLAQIAMLGDFGLKGSQAGTGIQAFLTRILTGDSTVITDAQAEIAPGNALEKFYEFEKIAKPDGNLLPMADIIDELNSTMEDMTDEEQAWFAKKLFGLYQMKSAYALMNGEEGELNKNIDEITNQSKGTNEAKLSQLLESQSGQLKSLNNLWEGIKTDFGSRLNPFVDAVRDELFNFLKNDGNYEINFDNLHDALSQSCDLIEEKYGSAIAKAVQNIGDFALDFAEVSIDLAPLLGDGLSKVFNSLFEGNILGNGGVADNWSDMISNMKLAVEGLPEDLQGLGGAIVGAIDWFGKLTAINIASNIAELVSSLLQILTIAGGAMINVAGGVVVNGAAVTTGAGTNFTQWGAPAGSSAVAGNKVGSTGTGGASSGGVSGASAVAKGGATGSTIIGSADDVAKALGTSADDVVATIGKQATYSVDDVAKSLGSSADEVISALGITSKNVTKLSKFGKTLGAIGIGVEAVSTGYEAYESFSSGDNKGGSQAIGNGIGSIGGGLAGAKIGAAIGTAIAPGIGTAIGGVLGSIAGSIGGGWLGKTAVGAIYDANTPRKIEASEVVTTKGAEYQETLNRLKQQYGALVQSGEEGSVAAYKLKSEIDNLDTALKTMGDVTVANLITKSDELAQAVDKINTSHMGKNEQADTDADQAKSQAIALDALPQEKNDDTKKIAQGLIDGLNEKYDMGLKMDDKGGYNMTTEEIFNAIDTYTDNVKKDNNNDALVGYLSQYKDALSQAQIAKETEQEALQEYNNHDGSKYENEYMQKWQLAHEATTTTQGELDKLSGLIRQRYTELGYDDKQIDQIMASLEVNTKGAIEVEEYDEKTKLNGDKKTKKAVPVDNETPTPRENTVEYDLKYKEIKRDFPELANLGKTLSTQKIGTLDEKGWTIALSKDNGKEAYKQLATEDRKAFKDAYIKAFSQDAWDEFEDDVKDNRTRVQKYKDSESLDHLMVRVTKDNQYKDYYDKNLDKRGNGYSVWTGTEEQLKTYMQGKEFISSPGSTPKKGDITDPYKLNDLDKNSKNGINDGLGQYTPKYGKTSVFDEKIIKISSDDKQYDKNLDKRGNGYYVWAGTEKEYKTWSSKQNFTTDGKNYKGDVNNPYIKPEFEYQSKDKSMSDLVSIAKSYLTGKQGSSTPSYNTGKNNQSAMIPYMSSYSPQKQNKSGGQNTDTSKPINTGDISKACEKGVVSGFTQYKSNESSKNNKMTANEVSINTRNIQLAGEINTPTPKQLSTHGVGNNTIKNEIDNQVSIDNQVHMQPQFNVSAPNVNVDVRVDREDRVVKQISILNPGQSSALNNWYSRTSSKYGKTSL